MMRIALDQREVQKWGKMCAKHPSSAVVAMLLRRAGSARVLETTYGEGRFYLVHRPPFLAGVDPARRQWLVRPDLFFEMPVQIFLEKLARGEVAVPRIDTVVCDPPWGRGEYRKRPHFAAARAVGSPQQIVECSAKVAELLGAKHFILHFDRVPAIEGMDAEAVVEFKPFTRYLNSGRTVTFFVLYSL